MSFGTSTRYLQQCERQLSGIDVTPCQLAHERIVTLSNGKESLASVCGEDVRQKRLSCAHSRIARNTIVSIANKLADLGIIPYVYAAKVEGLINVSTVTIESLDSTASKLVQRKYPVDYLRSRHTEIVGQLARQKDELLAVVQSEIQKRTSEINA